VALRDDQIAALEFGGGKGRTHVADSVVETRLFNRASFSSSSWLIS
jgi:hypothetical protein